MFITSSLFSLTAPPHFPSESDFRETMHGFQMKSDNTRFRLRAQFMFLLLSARLPFGQDAQVSAALGPPPLQLPAELSAATAGLEACPIALPVLIDDIVVV